MQTPSPRPIYIIGDVHGQLKKLVKLLQDRQLIDAEHSWKGVQRRSGLWGILSIVALTALLCWIW